MRKFVLLSLLALVCLPAFAEQPVPALATPDLEAAAPAVAADLALPALAAPLFPTETPVSTGCAAGTETSVFDGAVSWQCPFNAPRCHQHDDCDAYCGDPAFGYCNLPIGCCTCTG